ncbi:MAG: putative S-layer protein [Nanoarchaeota archaeon]
MLMRYFILSLILLISIISVSAQTIDVLETTVTVEMSQSSTETATINIKNNGASPVNVEFDISQLSLKDNDGDEISVSFSNPGTINPNQTANSTITIVTPNLIDFESFGGTAKVKVVNSTDQDTFTLQINVIPDVCDFGQVGNALTLDIEDPDSGDDFSPGDDLQTKVNVMNDGPVDIRVQAEAFLFTEGGREIASCASQVMNLEDGDDEDFECSLSIPFDPTEIDEDEDLRLFVKAFDDDNEQAQCVQSSIPLNVEIENKELIINNRNTRFLPQSASCGDLVLATVELINIGKKDNEAQIMLANRELGINLKSDKFRIESFSSEERNRETRQFEVNIPENARRKEYLFDLKVNFEGGSLTKIMPLNIVSCEETEFIVQDFSTQAFVNPIESRFTTKPSGFISIPVEVTNNLNKPSIFFVSVRNIGEFAEASTKQVFLQPAQKVTTFLELLVKDDVEPSIYSGTVEVRAGSKIVFSSPITVEIQEPEKIPQTKEIFKKIPLWFWVVVNLALIGLILISVKIVTNSKRK